MNNPASNPYGLDAMLSQGDPVSFTVLLILLLMSMGSWVIILTRLMAQWRLFGQARAAQQVLQDAGSAAQLIAGLQRDSTFAGLARAGVQAAQQHAGFRARVDFSDWVELSLQRAAERLQRQLQPGMGFLATVGSSSPFVGLFGTVWGIYHALTAIGLAGQASIEKVAGPVGEALIMTAVGLAVAVPAVLGYNALLRRNSLLMNDARDFCDTLHAQLLAWPGADPVDALAARPALHVTA
jgi:biopolymer transport protein ExbB